MKRVFITLTIFFISSSAIADELFDCSYLIGKWTGISTSEKYQEDVKFIVEYRENSEYLAYFDSSSHDGTWNEVAIDEREWFCDGEFFGTITISSTALPIEEMEAPKKVYRIIELTPSYRKYQTVSGNDPGVIYEAIKIND